MHSYLFIRVLFLNNGMRFASFHSKGTIPYFNDRFNAFVSGPTNGMRGGVTTRRSVEILFCTANDSMAGSVNSHDELEFTVTDDMLANLTLSPPQTLTHLTVVAEPPKAVKKAKGEEKTKTIVCISQCKHKEKKRAAWYNANFASFAACSYQS